MKRTAKVELQTSCCKNVKEVENNSEWWVIKKDLKGELAFELNLER